MSHRRLPGARDVHATLDKVADANGVTELSTGSADEQTHSTPSVVVACPPHPNHGGDRHDPRLRAVSDALRERGIDCLRFDYGAWDDGVGEQTDARTALSWASDEYEAVGLFGYSFGASVALVVAAEAGPAEPPQAVVALAPDASLVSADDVANSIGAGDRPTHLIVGLRDDVVDWEPVKEAARSRGVSVEEVRADHFFVGQGDTIGTNVADFFAEHLPSNASG